ncbi:FUSC family membrane protein [Rufibacter sp. XAAS-G3-1]|uniref:FUSC family membrane protein n=1 Tax=Rufibacter sp. XAAS-G3-1 TaxID=2729134 RepID=UPI0015E67076|nr:FUSC family membrane protein [Rufibacter sp. XAAS-G3-1]
MNRKVRELQYFFYSQNFYDGIRVTIAALLPALLMSFLGHFEWGIAISLGAIGVSLADSPGPMLHKRNGMLVGIGVCTLVALVTGFARMHVVTLGLEILVFSFVFSMLLVYGMRASFIGLGGLLVLVMTMDRPLETQQVLLNSALVMGGGVWYLLLSLVTNQFMPYRPAQQALGECIREVAKFLRMKADFYQPHTHLEESYRQLISQQVLVSEKQGAVRELLFKSRQMVKESTEAGRTLVMTFVDMVDLYEQVTAIHYDYTSIRERFGGTGVLQEIAEVIEHLADELDNIGFAIQANLRHKNLLNMSQKLEELKARIDAVGEQQGQSGNLVLKKIFVNIRTIAQRLSDILSYFNAHSEQVQRRARELEFSQFISHQNFDPKLFWNNLTFKSSVFRFSFRVALVALFAYALTKIFPYGQHSYWVLLTVIFLLKPAFSLTKQRNIQRVIGTVVGGAIGLLILFLVHDERLQFVFLLLFMTGFYSVQRINYVLSVILMTPFMLILFNFLGGGSLAIVQERVVDTVVGCAIAFAATYFVFPNWESKQVGGFMQAVLNANLRYLQVLADVLAGKEVLEVEYKLARKEVYVTSANLSAAFQRMTDEPKSKRLGSREIYQFVVLNHILSSYIATIVSARLRQESGSYPKSFLRTLRRAISSLTDALHAFDPTWQVPETNCLPAEPEAPEKKQLSSDELLLKEQLEFIRKVTADISKASAVLQGQVSRLFLKKQPQNGKKLGGGG